MLPTCQKELSRQRTTLKSRLASADELIPLVLMRLAEHFCSILQRYPLEPLLMQ
jgi:hypothetical protein